MKKRGATPLLVLWAMLVMKDPVTACSAVLLAKRLQSQGIARKLSSPPRSGIKPHLPQALMTWGRGAPQGKTLILLALQEHTSAWSLLNSDSLGCCPFGAGCWGASGG